MEAAGVMETTTCNYSKSSNKETKNKKKWEKSLINKPEMVQQVRIKDYGFQQLKLCVTQCMIKKREAENKARQTS